MKFFSSIKSSRGFTLIELLIVVAIIGILSAVVLSSLGSARNKAKDSAIKAQLSQMRSQAEMYADSNSSSYGPAFTTGACPTASATTDMFTKTSANSGLFDLIKGTRDSGSAVVTCGASTTGWAVSAQRVTNTAAYYCVDSTGAVKETTAAITGTSC